MSRREIDTYPLARPRDSRTASVRSGQGSQRGPYPERDRFSGYHLDRSHLDAAYQDDAYPDPNGRLREALGRPEEADEHPAYQPVHQATGPSRATAATAASAAPAATPVDDTMRLRSPARPTKGAEPTGLERGRPNRPGRIPSPTEPPGADAAGAVAPETGPLTAPVLAPLGHSPALDGLRALAVLSVMAYHAGLSWMPGGLLGVDAFFVLSGFLITGLLITEYRTTRRIDLKSFWIRRTRRLMPALLTMMLGVAAYARWVAAPSEVASLRMDALATLGYVANWRFALSDQSYFDHFSAPSPLLHTWSLAVEEQFYVLWPLCVYGLMWLSGRTLARWREQRRRAQSLIITVAVLGAEVSALLGLLLLVLNTDASRIYYGTDTRAQALLAGAALAVWRIQRRTPLTDRTRKGLAIVGCLAGVTMLTVWATVDGESRVLYSGGFLGVAVVVMLLIASIVEVPGGLAARVLSCPPLPSIGRVSYGLYLWHWPVFLTVTSARTGLDGVALLGARVAVTAGITVASFYLVENPIRRRRIRFPKPRITVPASILAIVAVVMVATVPDPSAGRDAGDLERLAQQAAGASGPTARTAAAAGGPALRAILAGDSLALTLGFSQFSVTAASQGVEVTDASELGCGVSRTPVRYLHGERDNPPPTCVNWPKRIQQKVNEVRPDVAMLLVGRWEVTDQVYNGRRTHIGDPEFDAYLGRELDLAITTLSAGGAKVALLTTPMFEEGEAADGSVFPETRVDRVIQFNELLRQAAARHASVATVIDLAAVLSPGNRYLGEVDGVQVRDDDGVHISNGGGARAGDLVVPRLLELLGRGSGGGGAAPSPAPE